MRHCVCTLYFLCPLSPTCLWVKNGHVAKHPPRLRVRAGPLVQEATCSSFDNLHLDVKRHCLLNSPLQLHDVARAAVTCKQLRELYHERCAADEQWLEFVAVAVFGEEFVELVVSWLASPGDDVPASFFARKSFDLTSGDTLPRFEDLRGLNHVDLMIPTWGRPECHRLDPPFQVLLFRTFGSRKVWMQPSIASTSWLGKFVDLTLRGSETREFAIKFSVLPALPVPVLGLVLMACKRVAALLATKADGPDQATQLHHSFRVHGQLEEEVRKALTILRMVAWRNRSTFPDFELEWCELDP
jgi:hypothetical protein